MSLLPTILPRFDALCSKNHVTSSLIFLDKFASSFDKLKIPAASSCCIASSTPAYIAGYKSDCTAIAANRAL